MDLLEYARRQKLAQEMTHEDPPENPWVKYGPGLLHFATGLIPIYGSGRDAVENYQQGNYGSAALDTAFAGLDAATLGGASALKGLPLFIGAVKASKKAKPAIAIPEGYVKGVKNLSSIPGIEPDMARSMAANKAFKEGVPPEAIQSAADTRAQIRSQPYVGGKPFADMTDAEIEAFGKQHGVDFTVNPMESVVDPQTGKAWDIPGGLNGKFSYTDLHRLKAQAYDPNNFSDAFHAQLQKKMGASVTPNDLNDLEVYNRGLFGLTSPNTPLLQNQFLTHQLRARSMDDLKNMAARLPDGQQKFSKAQNLDAQNQISNDFKLASTGTGNLGLRSSADLSWQPGFANHILENPEFFRKREGETWQQFTERVGNVTPGLGPKTGSFGLVWQNPLLAETSAMDRHMATKFHPTMAEDPEVVAKWAESHPGLWNDQVARRRDLEKEIRKKTADPAELREKLKDLPPEGAKLIRNYDQLQNSPGFNDWQIGRVKQEVTQNKDVKFRDPKGNIRDVVPEHLRDIPSGWEPTHAWTMGPMYEKMLAENARSAHEQGLGVFAEQWRLWDRIRKQLEPHEVMYPGLHNLPKMSDNELLDAYQAQKDAGFAANGGARPYDWKKGFVFSLPAMLAYGLSQRGVQQGSGDYGS